MNAEPPPLPPRLILASQSPRRAEILRQLGLSFEVVPADVDERYLAGETPAEHVERLARLKALAIASRCPDSLIIGSDTVVVLDGAILGKPSSQQQAIAMLERLSGREHEVLTAVALAAGSHLSSSLERVDVRFRVLDRAECEDYVATGEPMDKAGAYGIQGYGAALVQCIRGDYYAVVGLPVALTLRLLETAGWRYTFGGTLRPLRPRPDQQ